MIRWIPCELHTHTNNSDGSLTLKELAAKARDLGLECIALTDHNTISGHLDIPSVTNETGLRIAHGMEWTTFYGHMVAMGIKRYVDWRDKGPLDIQRGIREIHEAGGLAGVAHPYRMGSPMCTGCHWQFEVRDWSHADYIEVWSETFPSINPVNHRAYKLWTDLLNKGVRLAGVSGRDWHGSGSGKEPVAVTYLGMDESMMEDIDRAVMDALAAGRAASTMGPLMLLSAALKTSSEKYSVGEEIKFTDKDAEVKFTVDIDFSERKEHWEVDPDTLKIILTSNLGNIAESRIMVDNVNRSFALSAEGLRWVRAELYSRISGIDCMIAFTNPIYFTGV